MNKIKNYLCDLGSAICGVAAIIVGFYSALAIAVAVVLEKFGDWIVTVMNKIQKSKD